MRNCEIRMNSNYHFRKSTYLILKEINRISLHEKFGLLITFICLIIFFFLLPMKCIILIFQDIIFS